MNNDHIILEIEKIELFVRTDRDISLKTFIMIFWKL